MTGWAAPRLIAAYTHRPVATIRRWIRTGQLPTVCDAKTGQQLVHAATARRLAEQCATRRVKGRYLPSVSA